MPNRLATALIVIAFAAGCGSDSPAGPGGAGGPANGSLTAQIDGTAWTATTITPLMPALGSGGLAVMAAGNPDAAIGFGWMDQGPGTYTIPEAVGLNANLTLTAGGTWSARNDQGSGTVVVTTRTANRIVGTFQFVMPPAPSSNATGTRTITNGAFDVTF
jgi:hypothetical protein